MTAGEKDFAEIVVVVYFAIEHDPDETVFVRHGLGAGGSQVDDAEARVNERSVVEGTDAMIVGSAMVKGGGQSCGKGGVVWRRSEPAGYPTHSGRRFRAGVVGEEQDKEQRSGHWEGVAGSDTRHVKESFCKAVKGFDRGAWDRTQRNEIEWQTAVEDGDVVV